MGVLKKIKNKVKPSKLRQKVKNDVFKRYQKLRYMTRIKHWRGRDVHSPFAYELVRKALMDKGKSIGMIDSELFGYLRNHGVSSEQSRKICRVYAFLGYRTCCTDPLQYAGEDMVLILDYMPEEGIEALAGRIEAQNKRICMVYFGLYKTLPRHRVWHFIRDHVRCVSMDFYSFALLFFDQDLNPQYYKMKL